MSLKNLIPYSMFRLYQHYIYTIYLLKHEDVLASILHQNNQGNDDRLRNYQDGKAFQRNKLLSPTQNSWQLILYHDDFGTVNLLGKKVVSIRCQHFILF